MADTIRNKSNSWFARLQHIKVAKQYLTKGYILSGAGVASAFTAGFSSGFS